MSREVRSVRDGVITDRKNISSYTFETLSHEPYGEYVPGSIIAMNQEDKHFSLHGMESSPDRPLRFKLSFHLALGSSRAKSWISMVIKSDKLPANASKTHYTTAEPHRVLAPGLHNTAMTPPVRQAFAILVQFSFHKNYTASHQINFDLRIWKEQWFAMENTYLTKVSATRDTLMNLFWMGKVKPVDKGSPDQFLLLVPFSYEEVHFQNLWVPFENAIVFSVKWIHLDAFFGHLKFSQPTQCNKTFYSVTAYTECIKFTSVDVTRVYFTKHFPISMPTFQHFKHKFNRELQIAFGFPTDSFKPLMGDHKVKKSWDESSRLCHAVGGHLPRFIDEEALYKFVGLLLKAETIGFLSHIFIDERKHKVW